MDEYLLYIEHCLHDEVETMNSRSIESILVQIEYSWIGNIDVHFVESRQIILKICTIGDVDSKGKMNCLLSMSELTVRDRS